MIIKKINFSYNFLWILKTFWTLDKNYVLLSFIGLIINGLINPILVILMQNIINLVQLNSEFNNILFLIITYIFLEYVYTYLSNKIFITSKRFNLSFNLYFSEMIYNKLAKISLNNYENSETYDLIDRAQFDGRQQMISYFNGIISIISQSITLITFSYILIKLNIFLILVIIFISLIKYFINKFYNRKEFEIITKRTNDSRKTWYINYLLTFGNFHKELKVYDLFYYFISKYKKYTLKFNDEDIKIVKSKMNKFNLLALLESAINAYLYIHFISMAITGKLLIGDSLTLINSVINIKSNIISILLEITEINKQNLFINQLTTFLNMAEVDNTGKEKIDSIYKIEFKNVYYKYPSSNQYSLKNINMKIDSNEKILILGKNGSGKTTLIKLLMGFYLDFEGEIYINDIDIRKINTNSLLEQVSAVFQDFIKFEATIRENVAYSNLQIMNNDFEIKNRISKFQIDDILDYAYNNIDTQLGNWFDSGINLSAGQWQKIAICRAFMKNSSLYILDEPNASLDSITSYDLSRLYNNILYDKISIFIVHKINDFINISDKIYILEKGEIVEHGTFEELIKYGNKFNEMYEVK